MAWRKIRVTVNISSFTYYTDMNVDLDDEVVVETKEGALKAKVTSIGESIECNPFEKNEYGYKARRHVLENATKKIYNKENLIMFGSKTVEVKHISSSRLGVFYTDIELKEGDIVVYEGLNEKTNVPSMHVGIVVDADPDVVTAASYIVDKVDMTTYNERKERIKQAEKLRAKLDAKKQQFQDIELLRLIAANDPETKTMLDEYTKLIGGK